MARFCQNCGKEINPNADVCINCGMLIRKTSVIINNNSNNNIMPGWAIALIIISISVVIVLPIISFFITLLAYGI